MTARELMSLPLEDVQVSVICPHCAEATMLSLGSLKAAPTLICSACEDPISVDPAWEQPLESE